MRITRFERYKCIMKKHSCYVLLRFQFQDFFRYQIFPIPVPRLFSGTKFFRYRFRDFFPVPIFFDTGSDTTKNMKNSRYREFPVPVRRTLLIDHWHRWFFQWFSPNFGMMVNNGSNSSFKRTERTRNRHISHFVTNELDDRERRVMNPHQVI